jgi:hypothetical protein
MASCSTGEGLYPVHVAAGDAQGGMVAADGLFVGAFEQAIDHAVGVVVQLQLPDTELIGPRVAGVVGDLGDRLGGQLQVLVEVHES